MIKRFYEWVDAHSVLGPVLVVVLCFLSWIVVNVGLRVLTGNWCP